MKLEREVTVEIDGWLLEAVRGQHGGPDVTNRQLIEAALRTVSDLRCAGVMGLYVADAYQGPRADV